ncbi:nuclear pore complex component [Histoplasma capsulatum var. duboisii H88]|uniref:Nuclear pore complex component n=1 Tax=Ajellomyces capsulatus (strain H88) TaxID=544711 RepID=A0A8A1LJW0_AJEC8|nr:nuclear pore complex component [Histoplasma capsulatum var. duboisii H88]
MAPPSFPSTPTLQGNDSVSTASPGTWRHPQLKEIVRRQNASTFGDRNVKKIALNGGCLITSGFLGTSFRQCYQWLGSMLNIPTYPDLVLLAIRLLLLLNIVVALYPLYRPKDDLSDQVSRWIPIFTFAKPVISQGYGEWRERGSAKTEFWVSLSFRPVELSGKECI